MDLSKITVLAGAFGVGIGFGLQSIVNNFVSGLIVLFERPIDKGDSVEIGNLRGTVQHIGIRASVLRTASRGRYHRSQFAIHRGEGDQLDAPGIVRGGSSCRSA